MNSRPDDPDDGALEQALRRSRVLEDAPEALIRRAIDVWQPRPQAAAPAPPAPAARTAPAAPLAGALRRLAATLGFDSAGLAPQAAGLRSAPPHAGARAPRQLLYTADGRDIDLRLEPSADGRHWSVSGQVLGPDRQGLARLRSGADERESPWDEMAEFRFDAVPAGPVTLVLQGQDWMLELPTLDLAG